MYPYFWCLQYNVVTFCQVWPPELLRAFISPFTDTVFIACCMECYIYSEILQVEKKSFVKKENYACQNLWNSLTPGLLYSLLKKVLF